MPTPRRKPVIGVTGPDQAGQTLALFTTLAVRRQGGRPIRLSPRRRVDWEVLDGLVVSGGADIDPALYGQPNHASRRVDRQRDQLEAELIRWAIAHAKPVLGICRGAQLLNVALGGTLHQDARQVYPGFRPTRGWYRAGLRRPIHVLKAGWLSTILGTGKKTHLVNSLHHQAIAEVAPDLEVVAVDEHGLIQAIEGYYPDCLVVGVQWHPELMPGSRVQMAFFRELVAAAQATEDSSSSSG